MKTSLAPVLFIVVPIAALLAGCSEKPAAEPLRSVRTAEIRYDKAKETNRYVGTVQSRHEVNEAFRVGGKVLQRKVDVGQKVREGDVLAVLDDADYRHAEEAARQQFVAATTQARQAESDRKRLDALKSDGSVSVSDEEKAQSSAETATATAGATARQLELARNRLKYTVLRASQSGVVTAVRFEVGQVVAEGQPVVSIANEGEPEIVADVPEDHLSRVQGVALQGMARQRARPDVRRGAARTVAAGGGANANLPRSSETRACRGRCRSEPPPHSWSSARSPKLLRRRSLPRRSRRTRASRRCGSFIAPAASRSERWICSASPFTAIGTTKRSSPGPPAGELVITAGVQKMAPGLKVALSAAAPNVETKQADR